VDAVAVDWHEQDFVKVPATCLHSEPAAQVAAPLQSLGKQALVGAEAGTGRGQNQHEVFWAQLAVCPGPNKGLQGGNEVLGFSTEQK